MQKAFSPAAAREEKTTHSEYEIRGLCTLSMILLWYFKTGV